jgi:[methyl-Co(III) methanol-specific corrinoid protein]:coenzyme M methyltransferase
MSDRAEILELLSGKKISSKPSFSGLIHITAEGMEHEGLVFHEIHKDAKKMVKAAASTFRLTGMPSAALPLDLCAPAEALGAELNFYEQAGYRFPQPARPLFASTKYLNNAYLQSADFVKKGRIQIICEAMRLLKEDIGEEVVIGGIIPGPYTLLLYLIEPGGLFAEMKREPNAVLDALFHLSSFLGQIGNAYRESGADFITIHDMGGSPGFIGPPKYEQFVFPAEKQLIKELPKPCVLSVCGATNKSMHLLAQTGADAISVDQLTDLTAARAVLADTLLFGNLDPVATLWRGDAAQVTEEVHKSKEAGVDAVWPGCDLVIQTPIQNIAAISFHRR